MQLMFPRGFSANFLFILWALLGSVLIHGFLANFRVMLLKPVLEKPPDSAQDVLDRGLIPIVYNGGQYWIDRLADSDNPVYQQLAKKAYLPIDYADRLRAVKEDLMGAGTHVYIASNIRTQMKDYGFYYFSKEGIEGTSPWAVEVLNKRWPLNDDFNKHVLIFQQVCMVYCIITNHIQG